MGFPGTTAAEVTKALAATPVVSYPRTKLEVRAPASGRRESTSRLGHCAAP